MTSTLAQIAMILTVAAPLQTTSQAATKAQITELQETIDTQNKKIAALKESLDKTEPDGLTVLDRIDTIYNRILVSVFALTAVIGIVIPIRQ